MIKNNVTEKEPTIEDIRSFVRRWNINYPIDRWWRRKHGVIFNSQEHRVVSFLDQLIEYIEDHEYDKAYDNYKKDEDYKSGNWLKERESEISNEALVEDWENLKFTK